MEYKCATENPKNCAEVFTFFLFCDPIPFHNGIHLFCDPTPFHNGIHLFCDPTPFHNGIQIETIHKARNYPKLHENYTLEHFYINKNYNYNMLQHVLCNQL